MDYDQSPLSPIIRPLGIAVVLGLLVATFVGPAWGVIPLAFFGFDALGRLKDYFVLLHDDDTHPYQHIDYLKTSWCGRGVGIALYGDDASRVYEAKGYRWYHIIPDDILRRVWTAEFWRNFFYGRVE